MSTEYQSLQIRRLSDELAPEEAAAFDERRNQDPTLDASFGALESTWKALELPPPPTPDPYAASRWLATWRSPTEVNLRPSPAVSGLVLTAGLVLGLGMGWVLGDDEGLETSQDVLIAAALTEESSTLAESYWDLIDADVGAQ